MSLKIWLPLNGNLDNQGLSDLKFSLVNYAGAITSSTSGGKVVSGLYKRTIKETADYIVSNKSIVLDGDVSMCCWAKVTDVGYSGTANGLFGQHGHQTGGLGITMKDISSTDLRMSVNTGLYGDSHGSASDRTYDRYYGGTNIYNTWHHLCLTYSSSAKQLRMYVDGKPETIYDSTKGTSVGNYITLAGNNTIARPVILFAWSTDHLGSSIPYYRPPCELNDVRIYDNVLSPREIKEIAKGLSIHYQLKTSKAKNLMEGWGYGIYNNYEVASTIVATGETYRGYPIYRLTQTPTSDKLDSFQAELGSHGIMTSGYTFKGSTPYVYWVYARAVSHPQSTRMGGTASNIGHWNESGSEYLGDGWYRIGQYRTGSDASNKTDSIFTSYYVSNAQAGVPIVIEFCGQHLIEGVTSPPANTSWNANYDFEIDVSGFHQNASIISFGALAGTPDTPKYKNSLLFNNNAYMRLPSRSYSGMANSYTFAYWAKNSNMDGKMVWGFEDGNRLNVYPSSWFNWNTGNGAENPFILNGSNVAFTPYNGSWHHYAITGNGSTTTLYIDGNKAGTAKNYVGITGSQIIISGWDISGSYKWNGGNISDFRIYATCLSAEDVKELYNTPAVLSKDGTLMTGEFIEEHSLTTAPKISRNGVIYSLNGSTKNALLENMRIKALPDGSQWARIHHHDVRVAGNYFSTAEVANCDVAGKYSKMGSVTNFKDAAGKYEFMLTYPTIQKYAPAGYTLLECIEATGTQYINTGVYGYSDGTYIRGHRWEFDIEIKGGISHR